MMSRTLYLAAAVLLVGTCLNVDASRVTGTRSVHTQQAKQSHSTNSEDQALIGVHRYCHGLDCPRYQVLQTVESIQLRSYEASTWVYAKVPRAQSFEQATLVGGAEITRYFLGYNEANQMLHCTAPLVTKINILDDIDLDFGDNFTVAAYLPQEYQVSPPEPRSRDVETLELSKDIDAWVYTFSGFAFSPIIRHELRYMLDVLHDNEVEVDLSSIFVAQFDTPTTVFHRHNEIWVKAKSTKSKGHHHASLPSHL